MDGDVLEMEPLGLRAKILRSAQDTDGELLEMKVTGRPRGFLAQRHVHPEQVERLEVISGVIKVSMNGRAHVLREGQSIEVPAGTPHTQTPVGDGAGVVRIQVEPAGRTQAFMERLASLSAEGQFTRAGYPRPLAGAELVLEFSGAGHAAWPSMRARAWSPGLCSRSPGRCGHTRSPTSGMWPLLPRRCSMRSPTPAPIHSGGVRSTSRSSPTVPPN
jgi:quercetin dioxygenase-like cupin family protein